MGEFPQPFRGFGPRFVDVRFLELRRPLAYVTDSGTRITIPAGFVCDLASVPQALRSIAPPWQLSARPGVLHDYLYRRHARPAVVRELADDLFYGALRAEGVGRVRAWGMWAAVRAFGASSFRKRTVAWRPRVRESDRS